MNYPKFLKWTSVVVVALLLVIIFFPSRSVLSDYEYDDQFGTAGSGNGQFNLPTDVAEDALGNIYVLDSGNNRVQKFDNNGTFLLEWGTAGTGNGEFDIEYGQIAVDKFNDVYVVDSNNDRVQKFSPLGVYILEWGTTGSGNGEFNQPYGIAIDGGLNVYVTDMNNNRVQMFDSNGVYNGQFGSSGVGDGQFSSPHGIAVDNVAGDLYVVDSGNNRIQHFTSAGVFVDKFGTFGTGDGQFASDITDIAFDASNNIYVFDTANDRIQGFDSSYNFLETFGSTGTGNGQFNYSGQAAGGIFIEYLSHYMYVADAGNNRVQKFILDIIDPTAVLSTPSLAVTAPFTVTLTPDEAINDLTLADFTLTNAVASNLVGTGSGPYTVTITPLVAGVVTVQVGVGKFEDNSANTNSVATNTLSVTYSGTAVTANFCPTSKWQTGDSTHDYVVTLADTQTADGVFSASDAVYVGGGVPNTEISALGYDFSTIPATATVLDVTLNSEWQVNEAFVMGDREVLYAHFGTYNTNVALASLQPIGSTDLINIHNPTDTIVLNEVYSSSASLATTPTRTELQNMYLVAFNDGHLGFDYACAQVTYVIPPTAVLSTPSLSVDAPFTVTLTPNESITGLTLGDFTVTNGVASGLAGAGIGPYTVTITPNSNGNVTVVVPIGAFDNSYPTPNTTATNMLTVDYDAPGGGGGGSGGSIDYCTNLVGNQASIPVGYTRLANNTCVPIVAPPNPVDPPPVDPITPPAKTYVSPIDGYTKNCNAFTSYMRVYSPLNNTYQVRLWQAFLNERMNENLPITGFFGNLTFGAIKRFQSRYMTEILSPWGITAPTGYIYKSTRAQANKILGCSEGSVMLDNGVTITQ